MNLCTEMVEDLWQAISDKHFHKGVASDDQKLLNYALFKLGIQWQDTVSQQSRLFESYIGTAGNLVVVAVSANYSARASPSEFEALDHKKLRILHAKLSKHTGRKNHAILEFKDSLWKLSARFNTTIRSNIGEVMDLNRWLKEICL